MINLQIGDIIKLDENKEYVISATAKMNDNNYIYLVTLNEPYEVKFAKEIITAKDIDLEIVWDRKEKEELLEIFAKELNNLKF